MSTGSLLSLPWQVSVAWPIHRLDHSLQPAQARFSRVIGAASTLPWPDTRQNAASPAERPVWPVVAAAAGGAFLSAETMALGSLQVRTEASLQGCNLFHKNSPRVTAQPGFRSSLARSPW